MAPINVLWLIDHVCYDGSLHGGGRLFMNLAPMFDPNEVRVFPYFLRASDEVVELFKTAPMKVVNLNKGKYDLSTLTTITSLCKKHEIDVMHLFCYAASTFGRLAGKMNGVPTVVHDFDTQIYFPYPGYLKVADRMLASSTGHALAASPMCRDYMRDVRRLPADRLSIMPHAIPESRFEAARTTTREAARAELGWSPDEKVFVCLTKLGPERGNEYLMRAFAKVVAARPDTRLAFVYKPTYYHRTPKEYEGISWIRDTDHMLNELKKLIAELGIGHRVDLIEQLDQATTYMAAADAVVAPFLNERFSSVHLLEGFAHGLPAIATDLGEQKELLSHSAAGVLVKPDDQDALAAAMIEMVDNPDDRARRSAAAKEVAERHSVRANAAGLARMYRQLAQPQPVGSAAVRGSH
ncbi:glycosyltransferase family 4 protein [Geminicoccus roseus]|uniref:glycosyltransferase family 4 protein n=1 Tax=Geminicoccus roseus TaxID=404900 RepID=UPI0003F5547F|nr:glycosyltransferase family 4 protein [Geminicoccus roseus]